MNPPVSHTQWGTVNTGEGRGKVTTLNRCGWTMQLESLDASRAPRSARFWAHGCSHLTEGASGSLAWCHIGFLTAAKRLSLLLDGPDKPQLTGLGRRMLCAMSSMLHLRPYGMSPWREELLCPTLISHRCRGDHSPCSIMVRHQWWFSNQHYRMPDPRFSLLRLLVGLSAWMWN